MKTFIEFLKSRILNGGEISFDEALKLLSINSFDDEDVLLDAANEIARKFRPAEPDLCSLVNAKSYLCSEDCGFCSQSARYKTGVERYPLMEPDEILKRARACEDSGVESFCVVTSGETLNDEEFEKVLKTFQLLSRETNLRLDGSLGQLTSAQIKKLREAGMRKFNHNLQCSREFYPEIVSTHTYDERKETLAFLNDNDVEICSGGIFGMGESAVDRIKLAFELKPYKPNCVPINVLNPRSGTPLADKKPIDPRDVVKTAAIYRFIHPEANIKFAGGRELNLGVYFQEKAINGGVNGLIVGGYLTSGGGPLSEDMTMLNRAGRSCKQEHCSCGK